MVSIFKGGLGIPGMKMEKSAKQAFSGGIVASLAYYLEQAASEIVPNYPDFMMQSYPGLPRNGNLITTAVPVALGLGTQKMKSLKKYNSLGIGFICYSGPSLLHTLVKWAAYQAGYQTLANNLRYQVVRSSPLPLTRTSAFNAPVRAAMMGGNVGKYGMSTAPIVAGTTSGLGKYRMT